VELRGSRLSGEAVEPFEPDIDCRLNELHVHGAPMNISRIGAEFSSTLPAVGSRRSLKRAR
jgi:hypothetical protein